jgi:hypothetical protein
LPPEGSRRTASPDARAAHAALERIVRPPIALRVVSATVVLAAAAFAFGAI